MILNWGSKWEDLTSVVVLKVEESAGHSLPNLQSLPRLEPRTFGLQVRLSNISHLSENCFYTILWVCKPV